MVFSADAGWDPPRQALAVEPMTAPPDALNSGQGLLWLEPEQSWEGSWGLRYSAP
jgi:aldose 1-epimerase